MIQKEIKSQPTRAIRPQVLMSCACFLVGISYGMSTGHSAVLIPHLQSGNNSFSIDEDMGSWIASVYAMASPVGCLLGGISMDLWGRRSINLVGNVGMITGWLVITFAQNVTMFILGRIIEGFARSMLATATAVISDELADSTFRGFISCSIFTSVSVGIMAISGLGALTDWRVTCGIATLPSVMSFITFCFVCESPTWFVRKRRIDDAEKALLRLWGSGNESQAKEELNDLVTRLLPKEENRSSLNIHQIVVYVRGLFIPRIMKPFFIIHFFNVIQAFCGLHIFTYYTIDIISKSRKEGTQVMDDYSSTVVISAVRVITILISSFLMLKVGRRTLALISGVLSSAAALSLGVILVLHVIEPGSSITAHTESNITFTLMLIYAGSMSFGFFALPSIMIGETQPSEVRGFACGYIYTMNDLLLGGVVKMYPWMSSNLQIHGLFLFFGLSCVICTVFVYIFLPETQGLTLQEIEDYFMQSNVMWLTRKKYSKETKFNGEINADENKVTQNNVFCIIPSKELI